jgi:hypothetical protein
VALGRRRRTVLASDGDPSPLGGTIVIGEGPVLSPRGVACVASRTDGDGLPAAVLEARLPSRARR